MSTTSAIVLLSGGLDSATCLAIARSEGHRCHAISVRYGQRNSAELAAAARLAEAAGATHQVIDVDLAALGGSALTGEGPVRHPGTLAEITDGGVPETYVPARNTVLLAIGLAAAEVHGASEVFIGVNAVDYSGYPDCRPEFIEAFERTANLATRAATQEGRPLRIRAPLIAMSKAEIVALGAGLGLDQGATVSCYDPVDGLACGLCDACVLRQKGFADAGIEDPTAYGAGGSP